MIHQGNCVSVLRDRFAPESVQCCVTSPPYWGLRDYGCEGQLGLEATPELYVAKMVEVFREVKRVLKADGTLWLNLGDSYASDTKSGGRNDTKTMYGPNSQGLSNHIELKVKHGLKPKDLVGIPWRVAFALQADGWYLRSEIIWKKPNPMPESVTDRPTKAHEQIFLFAKGQSYSRTVLFSDIEPEFIHFGSNLGLEPSGLESSRLCVGLASTFFYAAQLQNNFSLPPFYSQEWEKGLNNENSHFVSSLPAIHRMAAYSSWLLNGKTSTKEFLHQTQRAFADLREADHLLISRSLAKGFNSPYVFIDGDKTIAVNDSGKVSKIDFSHEQIITKVPTTCKYYYDAEAIQEPLSESALSRYNYPFMCGDKEQKSNSRPGGATNTAGMKDMPNGRNKRTVWTVATSPYADAHFATFPPKLIEPCILAGSRSAGKRCDCDEIIATPLGTGEITDPSLETGRAGMNRPRRDDEGTRPITRREQRGYAMQLKRSPNRDLMRRIAGSAFEHYERTDLGGGRPLPPHLLKNWLACNWLVEPEACDCPIEPADIVLDPFAGSGTTIQVAQQLGRQGVGIELNPAYIALAETRTEQTGLAL